MSPKEHSFIVSDELEVPPTVNDAGEDERRGAMLSDRKASKVLGVTVLRAPRLRIVQKASQILGTNVVRSGVDWETRVNGGFTSARRNRVGEKFLKGKGAPLVLGGLTESRRVSGKEGQRVVLSPRWESFRMLRRHTISYESGLDLLLPEDGGEGSRSSLDWDISSEDALSETVTLADVEMVPPPVPTARWNPVSQRRREAIRSANKSVQILGVEARRAILDKMEKENAGRIGWTGDGCSQ
jgi:hypothetical protein